MTDTKLPCLILCGGTSRRFQDGHKALAQLDDKPLLQHVLDRIEPQCGEICLNAPDNTGFEVFELPLYPDAPGEAQGPLAGVLMAMKWADQGGYNRVLTCGNDTPFIPGDWVQKLSESKTDAIIVPFSKGNAHYVCALWPARMVQTLSTYLARGNRSVHGFIQSQAVELVEFNSEDDVDPFFNINTLDDLRIAEQMLQDLTRQ